MTLAHTQVWLRGADCNPLTTAWQADLAIQACNSTFLVNVFPEIIDQLKKRYSSPAVARCLSDFPVSDLDGKTLSFQVGSATAEQVAFIAGTTELEEVYAQLLAANFELVEVSMDNGVLTVSTKDRGPEVNMTIAGDSGLLWTSNNPSGSGYKIESRYYCGAQRIRLYPGNKKTLNHIELDLPPGCYKFWARVCFGNNEETNTVMSEITSCGCNIINLLLPTIKTCSAGVIHPLVDKIVYEGALADVEERLVAVKAIMFGANMGKQDLINQLTTRLADVTEYDDTTLIGRVQAVQALVDLLPDCN